MRTAQKIILGALCAVTGLLLAGCNNAIQTSAIRWQKLEAEVVESTNAAEIPVGKSAVTDAISEIVKRRPQYARIRITAPTELSGPNLITVVLPPDVAPEHLAQWLEGKIAFETSLPGHLLVGASQRGAALVIYEGPESVRNLSKNSPTSL